MMEDYELTQHRRVIENVNISWNACGFNTGKRVRTPGLELNVHPRSLPWLAQNIDFHLRS